MFVEGLFYEEPLMSSVYRANRKASDEDIIRFNSVGLSLATIAEILGCHPSTVTLRLKALGIDPADTRRAFMEDIIKMLPAKQQEWLADEMSDGTSIKLFVKNLIQKEFNQQQEGKPNA